MARKLTEPAKLLLTALAENDNHGYALAQRVAELTGNEIELGAGTLYATLDRLRVDGLIEEAGEEIVNGRARRTYRLSESGRHRVVEYARQLERQVDALSAALNPA